MRIILILAFLNGLAGLLPAEAERLSPPEIHIFIHVCTLNGWKEILGRQLMRIKASGLYEACDSISIGVLGPGRIRSFLKKYPKLHVLFQDPDMTQYERPTLLCLQSFAPTRPGALLLYIHTKGVTKPGNQNIADWTDLMEYFLIKRWPDCVAALQNSDACGVNWRQVPEPHFSGNFWWVTPAYASTLPTTIGPDYLDPEMWVGQNAPRVTCFHESHVEHTWHRYPPTKYKP